MKLVTVHPCFTHTAFIGAHLEPMVPGTIDDPAFWFTGNTEFKMRMCTVDAAREDYGVFIPAKKGGAK